MPINPSKTLETIENPQWRNTYAVRIECPEFTCLCPKTGQPDFATITIHYVPRFSIVELKSLKAYLWSFRDEGHFHEDVTNRILNDLVEALVPKGIVVTGDFNVRGGLHTVVKATHGETSDL